MKPTKRQPDRFPSVPFSGANSLLVLGTAIIWKDWKFGHIDLYIISTKKRAPRILSIEYWLFKLTGSLPKHSMYMVYLPTGMIDLYGKCK